MKKRNEEEDEGVLIGPGVESQATAGGPHPAFAGALHRRLHPRSRFRTRLVPRELDVVLTGDADLLDADGVVDHLGAGRAPAVVLEGSDEGVAEQPECAPVTDVDGGGAVGGDPAFAAVEDRSVDGTCAPGLGLCNQRCQHDERGCHRIIVGA
jgi:hypothetical protein